MMRTNLDSQVWRGRLKNAKEEAPRCLRQQRGAGELVGASVCVWCTRFDHIVHRSPSVKVFQGECSMGVQDSAVVTGTVAA